MAQGPMAMADHNFGPIGDEATDDLPRTFRREKEARAREARERAAQERAAAPSLSSAPDVHSGPSAHSGQSALAPKIYADSSVQQDVASDIPFPAAVQRFEVPFLHLMTFFLKAVLAAIPALILLTVVLWAAGSLLQTFFPDLVKMKILIGFQG
jgi:hypothetical protein